MDFPAAGTIQDSGNSVATQKALFEQWLGATRHLPGARAESELTISAGAVTPDRALHRLDTEGDAASDDLDNILLDNLPDGAMLKLVPENAARVATLRHQQGGDGELVLTNGESFALDHAGKWIRLRRKGTQWIEVLRSTVFGRRLGATADAAAARSLLGLGTAATQNTGTSGANVPLLNGANTHSGVTAFSALLDAQSETRLSGAISPAQLTANQDNWNPTGLSGAVAIRFSTNASRDITGIQGGAAGRVLLLANIGSQNAVLKHDVTSTAAHRFFCPGGADYTLAGGERVWLWYDTAASRWLVLQVQKPAAATSDVVLLSSQSPSGASSVNFSGLLTSTYHSYQLVFDLRVSVDDAALFLRTDSNDGASYDAGASDYNYQGQGRNVAGTGYDFDSAGAAQILITKAAGNNAVGNASGEGASGDVRIFRPSQTTHYKGVRFETIWFDPSGVQHSAHGQGARIATAAIDSIQILPSSGNLTGTAQLYGFKP
jgi:hypothetical protein